MIKGPGSSSSVDETDTPLVLGKEKTGISSPTLSRGANGLGGLPVSLAVAIEVSFGLLYYPPPRHAPVARQFDFCHRVPRQLMLLGHRQHHSEARLGAHHPCVSLCIGSYRSGCSDRPRRVAPSSRAAAAHICQAGSRTAVP